jgi:hypothetical protein
LRLRRGRSAALRLTLPLPAAKHGRQPAEHPPAAKLRRAGDGSLWGKRRAKRLGERCACVVRARQLLLLRFDLKLHQATPFGVGHALRNAAAKTAKSPKPGCAKSRHASP